MIDFLFVTKQTQVKNAVNQCALDLGVCCVIQSNFEDVLQTIEEKYIKYIFIDIHDPEIKGLPLLEWIQTKYLFSNIGILAQKTYRPEYIRSLELGATEQITYANASQTVWLNFYLKELIKQRTLLDQAINYECQTSRAESFFWVGQSPEAISLLERVKYLSQISKPLLITGEQGVGKRHLAHIIAAEKKDVVAAHLLDAKKIPDFEHKAWLVDWFTKMNIHEQKKRTHDTCNNELLLIINEFTLLHPEIQEVLAEYLKDNVFQLSGKFYPVKLQIVLTTSLNIKQAMQDGFLREDLFYILKNRNIHITPLRERVQDVPVLVKHYVNKWQQEDNYVFFSRDAMTAMLQYDWPLNTQELVLCVKEILTKINSGMVSSHMLPNSILHKTFYKTKSQEENLVDKPYNEAKNKVVSDFTERYVQELLNRVDGNLTVAAEKAGMDRSNFKKIMKKYQIT